MTITPTNIIRPTSVSIMRRERYSRTGIEVTSLSARERIKRFTEILSLVSSTRTDADRSRLDVTRSQSISHRIQFTKHPVPRGNRISDHSYEEPTTIKFSGIFTETPFIPYTAGDSAGLITRGSLNINGDGEPASRVQEQIQILDRMKDRRELLFVASSIKTLDYMAISKLNYSRRTDTGAAVVVDIEMEQIMVIEEIQRDPIPDSLMAQMGAGPLQSASGGQ